MKIIYNDCFGGFAIPDEICNKLELHTYDDGRAVRTNPTFIEWVEEHNLDYGECNCTELRVADIPEEATDWVITDYDGVETIYYVIDGKILRYEEEYEEYEEE